MNEDTRRIRIHYLTDMTNLSRQQYNHSLSQAANDLKYWMSAPTTVAWYMLGNALDLVRGATFNKEKQLALAARSEYEIKALQKAVDTEDYRELMEIMWSYKQLVVGMLYVKYLIRRQRAEELFSIAVEHTTTRIKRDHIVVRNILWTLIHCAHQAKLNQA